MNIINSILGIILLAILVIIGYRVGQMVIELNTPIIPKTNTAQIAIQEQTRSSSARWNHFPLTVYINEEFIQNRSIGYLDDVKQALNLWQATGEVSFLIASSPDADITIEWTQKLKEKSLDILGNTDIQFVNTTSFGIIQNAKIQLLTKSESRELNSNDMVNLALHEIGHAVGLQHSSGGIMDSVLIVPSKSIKEISTSDIDNLKELYKLPAKPDIKLSGVNATKFTFTRFGKDYFYLNISVSIFNAGLVDAKDFNLQLTADNTVVNEQNITILEVGNTLNSFQGNLRIDKNFTSLQVALDSRNSVDELNETNNLVSIEV